VIRRVCLLLLMVVLVGPAFAVTTPANAADPRVRLSSSTLVSSVGDPVTLFASIDSSLEARTVQFVANPRTSTEKLLGSVDVLDNAASVAYSRDNAVIDTIVAQTDSDGPDHESQSITVEWKEPVPVLALRLTPDGPSTEVGKPFTVTATLISDGPPQNGRIIHFRATRPGQPTEISDPPISGGRATFSYTRTAPGIDTITALLDDSDVSKRIRHKWVKVDPPPETLQVTATPKGTSGVVGSTFTVTVNVSSGTPARPQAGAMVTLTSTMSGSATETRSGATNQSGRVDFSYSRDKPGSDIISVRAVHGDRNATDSLTRRWDPLPALVVTASPDGTTGAVGSTFTVTASVTSGGSALAGAAVTLTSTMADAPPVTRAGKTDPSGRVVLEYPRDKPGSDTISVLAVFDGRSDTDSLTRTWVRVIGPTPVLTASPDGTTGVVGSLFPVRALVTLGGSPQVGVSVTLTSTMPGVPTVTRSGRTDVSGNVDLGYVRHKPGTDTIQVSAEIGGLSATDSLTREWIVANPKTPVLKLAPDGTTGIAGTTFTTTATLTRSAGPIAGRVVDFRATLKGQPDRTGTATTDAKGVALFGFTRLVAGADNIQASVLVDGVLAADSIGRRWTIAATVPVPPDLGTTSPGGVATVKGSGCRPGAPVVVMAGGTKVATTLAGPDGEYGMRAALANLPVGRHAVQISCGDRVTERTLDVVAVSASTGTAAASVVTSSSVLLFFLLLAITLRSGFLPAAASTTFSKKTSDADQPS
jgi:hypothetical protein